MKNEIPAKGDLSYYNLSEILTNLKKYQKTGILAFENKDARKSIFFKGGNAVFASSNQEEDRLGNILLNEGKITTEQFDESTKILKKTGKRHRAILIELGYLTPSELFQEVKNQIEEMILSLFLWDEGTFIFKEASPSSELITLKIEIEDLIREGVGRKESKKKEVQDFFIKKANVLFTNINTLSYYEIIGVDVGASPSEIKKAYLKMARNFHPDRYQNFPDSSLQDMLKTLFSSINEAYNTLSDKIKREEYDKILLKKITKKDAASGKISAEEQFNRGMDEYRKGNFWGAVDFLRWATRKDPAKADYWAYLSLSLSKISRRSKEAEEAILKAIELESYNAGYYVHLGTIYLQAGLNKRAVVQFEKALIWDPENKKAQKELEKLKK